MNEKEILKTASHHYLINSKTSRSLNHLSTQVGLQAPGGLAQLKGQLLLTRAACSPA